MQFHTLVFLCVFFPLSCFLFLILPGRFRLTLIAIESMLFYYLCQPESIWIYIGILFLNYMFGMLLHIVRDYEKFFVRIILFFGICWNLIILGYFKYYVVYNVMSENPEQRIQNYVVPLGISYIIFQGISMLVDVACNRADMNINPLRTVVHLSFFANVTAGPIQKYHELKKQIDYYNGARGADISNGLFRISTGLAKKLIIADTLGTCVDKIWSALSLTGITAPTAWLCGLCYMFQIYFDFSGYSDMAIGIAGVFGLKFAENFRYPYIASGMGDFWRRWHISLSSWFREYVYIPLGGNRKGITWLNILLVFILTGIWHGQGLTFFVWGVYNGLAVLADRYLQRIARDSIPGNILLRVGMLLTVFVGWIIFRAPTMPLLGSFVSAMFSFGKKDLRFTFAYYAERKTVLILIAAMIGATPLPIKLSGTVRKYRCFKAVKTAVMAAFMIMAIIEIVSSTYSPFIYFNF